MRNYSSLKTLINKTSYNSPRSSPQKKVGSKVVVAEEAPAQAQYKLYQNIKSKLADKPKGPSPASRYSNYGRQASLLKALTSKQTEQLDKVHNPSESKAKQRDQKAKVVKSSRSHKSASFIGQDNSETHKRQKRQLKRACNSFARNKDNSKNRTAGRLYSSKLLRTKPSRDPSLSYARSNRCGMTDSSQLNELGLDNLDQLAEINAQLLSTVDRIQ